MAAAAGCEAEAEDFPAHFSGFFAISKSRTGWWNGGGCGRANGAGEGTSEQMARVGELNGCATSMMALCA